MHGNFSPLQPGKGGLAAPAQAFLFSGGCRQRPAWARCRKRKPFTEAPLPALPLVSEGNKNPLPKPVSYTHLDSDDPFNEVSGSTGIIGAADTSFILKRKRTKDTASLLVSGRDVEYQELTLQFNELIWELVERKNSDDIHKAELPPFLFQIEKFMKNRTEWVGTATELLADMQETEITPNVVTKYLGQFSCEVLEPSGIESVSYTHLDVYKRQIEYTFKTSDEFFRVMFDIKI